MNGFKVVTKTETMGLTKEYIESELYKIFSKHI